MKLDPPIIISSNSNSTENVPNTNNEKISQKVQNTPIDQNKITVHSSLTVMDENTKKPPRKIGFTTAKAPVAVINQPEVKLSADPSSAGLEEPQLKNNTPTEQSLKPKRIRNPPHIIA